MLRTVADLLVAIDRLPVDARAAARARVDDAVQLDAAGCRAALGLLALDLAGPARDARELEVRVHTIHLDAVVGVSA